MTGLQMLGALLLALPFIAVAWAIVRAYGWVALAQIAGGSLLLYLCGLFGAMLLSR